jgi:hypothetical protein
MDQVLCGYAKRYLPEVVIAAAKNNVRFLVIPAEAGIHPASRGTGSGTGPG